MKIVTVLGARPQFIKAAVFSRYLSSVPDGGLSEVLVHTGQHSDPNMSGIFFDEMKIPEPKYHLNISGGSHGAMTGRMLEKVEEVLLAEKPDVVMVYGDTNSTLAGALAAVKMHIPVAHVEAGLRSFNRKMPEEINRILTDEISDWLFTPVENASQNLENEGIDTKRIHLVGDIMLEAALYYREFAKASSAIEKLMDSSTGFYLATLHRAENTDNPMRLRSIFEALSEIGSKFPVILPLHPRTKKHLLELNIKPKNVILTDPVGYLDMLSLLARCQAVLTDSGGLQKEAYFFGKACLTMRDETEWVELVESGANKLVGTDRKKIVEALAKLSSEKLDFTKTLYGDGIVAAKMFKILKSKI